MSTRKWYTGPRADIGQRQKEWEEGPEFDLLFYEDGKYDVGDWVKTPTGGGEVVDAFWSDEDAQPAYSVRDSTSHRVEHFTENELRRSYE